MKTLEEQFLYIKKKKKIGLMTHAVIGFPNKEGTKKIVRQMVSAGVDCIELQIPFSDPLADGPTIMRANDIALEKGITLNECFLLAEEIIKEIEIPILFMGYYNSLFHYGVEKFCQRSKEVGIQGLIVPDVPIDEEPNEHFISVCEKYKLHHIRLLSPTSTTDRIQQNARVQNGFVYCTTKSGVTGSGKNIDPLLDTFLRRVKKDIHVPIAVGFGISERKHVAALIGKADMAVVGSAIIECIQQKGMNAVHDFIHDRFIV